MFEFEAYEVLKIKEFTVVNDCFQNEHNEKIGHYRQTLISVCPLSLFLPLIARIIANILVQIRGYFFEFTDTH